MTFVDTNFFLRFLLRDNQEQYLIVKRLFLVAATGKEQLGTSLIVFFEIYWVLSSYYGKDKEELTSTLTKILALTFIRFENRELLKESITLFSQKNISLEDCYILAFSRREGVRKIHTFDQTLEKMFKLATSE